MKDILTYGEWAVHPNGKMVNQKGMVIPVNELQHDGWLLFFSGQKRTDLNDFIPAWMQACRNAGIAEISQKTTTLPKYLREKSI